MTGLPLRKCFPRIFSSLLMRMRIVERPLVSFVVIHLKTSTLWFMFPLRKVFVEPVPLYVWFLLMHWFHVALDIMFCGCSFLLFVLASGDLSSFDVEFLSKFDVVVVSCCTLSAKVMWKTCVCVCISEGLHSHCVLNYSTPFWYCKLSCNILLGLYSFAVETG